MRRLGELRLDRLGTVGLVRPIRRMCGRLLEGRRSHLPILMYHSVSDDQELDRHPYHRVCTSPARFAEQMQWLSDLGFRGVSLAEGLAVLRASEPGRHDSSRVAVITFDDGFRDFYTQAYPALQRHGFSATMYVPTDFMGGDQGAGRQTFKTRECLMWSEVRELHGRGIEFGSHTVTHPRLIKLALPEIERELKDSRLVLERNLGVPIRTFAFPYDFPQSEPEFRRILRGMLTKAGYETCVTTVIGRAKPDSDLLCLPRLPANSADKHDLFAAKLEGSYDWMAVPQFASKLANRWIFRVSRPRELNRLAT